jgi:hypothetical protein
LLCSLWCRDFCLLALIVLRSRKMLMNPKVSCLASIALILYSCTNFLLLEPSVYHLLIYSCCSRSSYSRDFFRSRTEDHF